MLFHEMNFIKRDEYYNECGKNMEPCSSKSKSTFAGSLPRFPPSATLAGLWWRVNYGYAVTADQQPRFTFCTFRFVFLHTVLFYKLCATAAALTRK